MKILIESSQQVRELQEGFANEAELQRFLRDYAELMPVDEIDLGTRPVLCIGSEVRSRSASEQLAGEGWQDLLYLDETGLLTIVETKLGRNRESHREVVGQILEYAAYACEWTEVDIRDKADKFLRSDECPEKYRDLSLAEALSRFREEVNPATLAGFTADDLIAHVVRRLGDGQLRLIIAIDEPPTSLRKLVEFVNRHSEHFEIYLFQLKRFHDAATGANIFIPALFGRVPKPEADRKRPRLWDREALLEQVAQRFPAKRDITERLITLCEGQQAISWGRGAVLGTFGFHVRAKDSNRTVPAFGGGGDGKILLDFKTLSECLDSDLVEQYRDALRRVDGIPAEVVDTRTWRQFDAAVLEDEAAYNAFVDAVLQLQTGAAERCRPKS